MTRLLLFLALLHPTAFADKTLEAVAQGQKRSGWNFSELDKTPVQNGGRVKPFGSFARESTLFVTGGRRYQRWGPTDWLLSLITAPKYWEKQKIIKISHHEVKRQLLLKEERQHFSPAELLKNVTLLQYAGDFNAPQTVKDEARKGSREAELKKLVGQLSVFRALISGQAWTVIPSPGREPWRDLDPRRKAKKGDQSIRNHFNLVIAAYFANNRAAFETATPLARASVEQRMDPAIKQDAIQLITWEHFYNGLRPFFWGWIIYLLAALLWVGFILKKKPLWFWTAAGLTVLGNGLHILGFTLRCLIAGRPPVSNMYESVIWVALGIFLFAWILYRSQKRPVIMAAASFVGAFFLIAADAAPAILDPSLSPLVPVLRSNLWLTVHVLTITLGYSAFALTMGISNVTLFQYLRGGGVDRKRVEELNQLSYRTMQFGVVLLAAGTILGGVWADYSWGRFWGWDPKEVWALIALLIYLAILHGRFTGWVQQFEFAAFTVLGFLSVVMAWYGVNFVLGAGLHSYGFSAGGGSTVALACLIQAAFVLAAYLARRAGAKRPA